MYNVQKLINGILFVCWVTLPDVEKITCGETRIISIQYHLFVKFINSIFQTLKKREQGNELRK
jgi:hypothetical protein